MKRVDRIEHVFVEFVPDELAEATLYISMPYATAVHSCLCGCGQRVVTPLSPTAATGTRSFFISLLLSDRG